MGKISVSCFALWFLLSICYGYELPLTSPTPLKVTPTRDFISGFLIGMQNDTQENAYTSCATGVSTLLDQFDYTLANFTQAYTPGGILNLVQSYMLSVETLSAWMVDCDWGAFIIKLDETVETFSGFTTFVYELVLNFNSLTGYAISFYSYLTTQNYLSAGISMGQIVSTVFEFHLDN